MKKNTFFLTAMLAVTLAFGLVFVGCDNGNNTDNNTGGGEAAAIAAITDAAGADNKEAMKVALENNASALGLDLTAYNALSSNDKLNVADAMQYAVQMRVASGGSVTAAWIKEAFDQFVAS